QARERRCQLVEGPGGLLDGKRHAIHALRGLLGRLPCGLPQLFDVLVNPGYGLVRGGGSEIDLDVDAITGHWVWWSASSSARSGNDRAPQPECGEAETPGNWLAGTTTPFAPGRRSRGPR